MCVSVARVPPARRLVRQGSDLALGMDLVRFTESLLTASNLQALKERYLADFGRLLGVSINGFDLVDPETTRQTFSAAVKRRVPWPPSRRASARSQPWSSMDTATARSPSSCA